MPHATPSPGYRPVRHDELRQEYEHDAYRSQQKPEEPAVCPDCGAVCHEGRWQWLARPEGAHEVVCPACLRIRDRFPAGFADIGGEFFRSHRDELIHLIRHHEAKAKGEHALVRIMDIEDTDDGILVTTTDIRLARDIGDALHRAYSGELEYHYNEGEKLLRVHWRR